QPHVGIDADEPFAVPNQFGAARGTAEEFLGGFKFKRHVESSGLSRSEPTSESAVGANVLEVAEVVTDSNVVENAAQRPDGDSHSVGTAEAPELAAPLEVRFDFEEESRHAELFHFLVERGEMFAEVAENQFVSGVPFVGRDEVLQPF